MKGLGFYDKEFFVIKSDKENISESVTRILMTSPGERVGQPFFGVGLKRMLFDQVDQVTLEQLQKTIQDQIDMYEPRVVLTTNEVNLRPDENAIDIKLGFKMIDDLQENEDFISLSVDIVK